MHDFSRNSTKQHRIAPKFGYFTYHLLQDYQGAEDCFYPEGGSGGEKNFWEWID